MPGRLFDKKDKNRINVIFVLKLITGTVEECEPGMVFESHGCVESTRAFCDDKTLNEDAFESNTYIPADPKFNPNDVCVGITLAFKPHPEECTSFIICNNEVGEIRSCPGPIPIFHPSRLVCVAGKLISMVFCQCKRNLKSVWSSCFIVIKRFFFLKEIRRLVKFLKSEFTSFC